MAPCIIPGRHCPVSCGHALQQLGMAPSSIWLACRACPCAQVWNRQPPRCTGELSADTLQRQAPVCTCRQALKEGFTARQFRLMFALSPWEKGLQYGPQLSEEMAAKEGMLKNFFQNIEVALRQSGAGGPSQARWEVRLNLCLGGCGQAPC